MRRLRQLLVLLFVAGCVHSVSAQRRYRMHEHKSQPAVYLIAVEQDGTLYEAYARGRAADDIMVDFAQTRRTGFQQVVDPQFIFTTKNNRFSLGIGGYVPVRKVYSFDPYDRLSSAEQSCIQGVQGNIWTEYIASFAHAQHMALPRLAALAEVGWACDFGDFTRRMTVFRKLYDKCGYRYASYFFDGTGE